MLKPESVARAQLSVSIVSFWVILVYHILTQKVMTECITNISHFPMWSEVLHSSSPFSSDMPSSLLHFQQPLPPPLGPNSLPLSFLHLVTTTCQPQPLIDDQHMFAMSPQRRKGCPYQWWMGRTSTNCHHWSPYSLSTSFASLKGNLALLLCIVILY